MNDDEALLEPWTPEGIKNEPWSQAFLADGGQVQIALPQVEVLTRFTDALVRVTAAPKGGEPIRTDFKVRVLRAVNELGLRVGKDPMGPDRWALTIEGTWPVNWPTAWAGHLNAALNRHWLDIAETEHLAGRLDMLPFVPPGLEIPAKKKRGRPRRLPDVIPQQTYPEAEAVVFFLDDVRGGLTNTRRLEGEVAITHQRPGSSLW